ncbi:uncharacterized protein LOC133915549 isoform X2 [Phragmites australis]|uniref:uncharacterized protein LOC133915549 isoform X2 n=1 Tax=Phragmites australis TaxID=29695 RepID=UPI002D772B95|nr:uncharacterized protein LOC133915549 isoform X2 [Phragmites australis]
MRSLGVRVAMEKQDGVNKAVEATPTLNVPQAPQKEPEQLEKCYKKTVGEDATFLESAKDYFNQFKDMTAQKHWICLKNRARAAGEYVSQKSGSVFGKQNVDPVVNDSTPEVAKPAAVESH